MNPYSVVEHNYVTERLELEYLSLCDYVQSSLILLLSSIKTLEHRQGKRTMHRPVRDALLGGAACCAALLLAHRGIAGRLGVWRITDLTQGSASAPTSEFECVQYDALLDHLDVVMTSLGEVRVFEPDGPTLTPAALPDVIEDRSGMLATLPILDAASMNSPSSRRIRAIGMPFVVRGHPAAMQLSRAEWWRNPAMLCDTHPTFCAEEFSLVQSAWSWRGRQMQYIDRTKQVADPPQRLESCNTPKYGVVNASSEAQPLSTFVLRTTGANGSVEQAESARTHVERQEEDDCCDELGARHASWSAVLRFGAFTAEPLVYDAMIPDGGLEGARPVNAEDETLTLRVGREAYVGNFHLDRIHNWILGVAHSRKRAVLVHPYEDDCLKVETNISSAAFRQSPLPVLHARRWLLEHCPGSDEEMPRAAARLREGDLLYVPALWLHSIETAPGDSGWWTSLNRFMPEIVGRCADDLSCLVDVDAWRGGEGARPWAANEGGAPLV